MFHQSDVKGSQYKACDAPFCKQIYQIFGLIKARYHQKMGWLTGLEGDQTDHEGPEKENCSSMANWDTPKSHGKHSLKVFKMACAKILDYVHTNQNLNLELVQIIYDLIDYSFKDKYPGRTTEAILTLEKYYEKFGIRRNSSSTKSRSFNARGLNKRYRANLATITISTRLSQQDVKALVDNLVDAFEFIFDTETQRGSSNLELLVELRDCLCGMLKENQTGSNQSFCDLNRYGTIDEVNEEEEVATSEKKRRGARNRRTAQSLEPARKGIVTSSLDRMLAEVNMVPAGLNTPSKNCQSMFINRKCSSQFEEKAEEEQNPMADLQEVERGQQNKKKQDREILNTPSSFSPLSPPRKGDLTLEGGRRDPIGPISHFQPKAGNKTGKSENEIPRVTVRMGDARRNQDTPNFTRNRPRAPTLVQAQLDSVRLNPFTTRRIVEDSNFEDESSIFTPTQQPCSPHQRHLQANSVQNNGQRIGSTLSHLFLDRVKARMLTRVVFRGQTYELKYPINNKLNPFSVRLVAYQSLLEQGIRKELKFGIERKLVNDSDSRAKLATIRFSGATKELKLDDAAYLISRALTIVKRKAIMIRKIPETLLDVQKGDDLKEDILGKRMDEDIKKLVTKDLILFSKIWNHSQSHQDLQSMLEFIIEKMILPIEASEGTISILNPEGTSRTNRSVSQPATCRMTPRTSFNASNYTSQGNQSRDHERPSHKMGSAQRNTATSLNKSNDLSGTTTESQKKPCSAYKEIIFDQPSIITSYPYLAQSSSECDQGYVLRIKDYLGCLSRRHLSSLLAKIDYREPRYILTAVYVRKLIDEFGKAERRRGHRRRSKTQLPAKSLI